MPRDFRYYSICSGIGACKLASRSLGWECAAFSEIDKFPSAVLKYHFPEIPNLGDFTKTGIEDVGPVDAIVGGTPCQDFSIAGLRAGMDGARGNLAVEFVRLVDRIRPRWFLWENVPGCLSTNGGRDFGTFLGLLGQIGYGFSYRVFDAQYFGLAQRRERVFVVGHIGGLWQRCAAVLFEPESLRRYPAPRRTQGQVSPTLSASGAGTSRTGGQAAELDFMIPVAHCLRAQENAIHRADSDNYVVGAVSAKWAKGTGGPSGDECQNLVVSIQNATRGESNQNGLGVSEGGIMFTLDTASQHAVCFQQNTRDEVRLIGGNGDIAGALAAEPGMKQQNYIAGSGVRRLTPRECERLQGYPDDWTLIPWRGKLREQCPDGPRYKAIGNGWAVPNVEWVFRRIGMVDEICRRLEAKNAA